jgi:hypothetical protein
MKANFEREPAVRGNQSASPRNLGDKWLDGQLAPFLASTRKRLTANMVMASSTLALTSGLSTFAYSSLAQDAGPHGMLGGLGAAARP